MKLVGTKFQLKVLAYLRKILAEALKHTQVAKGIETTCCTCCGQCYRKNPFAPRIPCHRVIRSDGSLGGYSGKGGVKTKRFLQKRGYKALELLFDGRSGLLAPI